MSDTQQKRYDYQGVKKWFNNKFPEYGKDEFVQYDGFALKIEAQPPISNFGREYYLDSCKVKFSISCSELDYTQRGKLERGQYKLSTITKKVIDERIDKIKIEVGKLLDAKKEYADWQDKNWNQAKKLIKEAFPKDDLTVSPCGYNYCVKKGDVSMFKFFLHNNEIQSVDISLTGSLESLKQVIQYKIWGNGK